jgi:Ethanolamine utilization protein EutJ (predicted chaperonin)
VTRSRFIVGIDLGTTNSALAYIDTGSGEGKDPVLVLFSIPQVVQQGAVEDRPLLPSFLYLPGKNEQPAGSLKLPWAPERDFAVGEFARNFGTQVPTRLVSSAKSWLSHAGIDRRSAALPWKAPEGGRRVSPVEASTMYLKHIAEAWNFTVGRDVPENRLERQDIVLTVPASFDAVARELTVEAARAAGLENITLLEEPQAAFYSWIEASHEKWRDKVQVGDIVLICDVGGGTTDLSLIAIGEEKGNLAMSRIAVGDHILLGGDNMDLALAHTASAALAAKGTKLDAGQMNMLWHSCRGAKEKLFTESKLASAPVTVLGRGSRVIGGTIQGELNRADVEKVLVDGFFPECPLEAEPARQRSIGLQELGLPYASDPAITKHLAKFITRNASNLAEHAAASKRKKKSQLPTQVLFNGGVFKAIPLRERLLNILNKWAGSSQVKTLEGTDLDVAVARGAAYYGLVRRGKGVRIRGGTGRSYYIGVETSLPAVPGAKPPIKALCVVPFGMEEGTEADMPKQEFGLVVGEPVEFRFLGSSVRRNDPPGTIVEEWDTDIQELTPVATEFDSPGKEGRTVPVHLHSKVTEVGTLELFCISRDNKQKWKLEFNVREKPAE